MGSTTLIVSEYLSSLKEDTELDYLFPIMLNLMGFKIITTPKESKGQPQYGKDIVAVGIDDDGIKKRFYFELKGYSDKDIDDAVLMKPDGIIQSLLASKYTNFTDSSILGFSELPVKIILVHNGILKSNTRRTFDGFIDQHFPEKNFERWDIYKITDLFSKHLFGEHLLTDEESIRLFKRTLVLLDAPDYDYSDFKLIVQQQLEKISTVKSRAFTKFFATMNLLSLLIVHYSKENNNLEPAKQCLTYLVLEIWHWILKANLAAKKSVIREYRKLVKIHFELLQDYFEKTLPIACEPNGLFSERGGPFESLGYPLRCFEYLNYLIYYFEARTYYPKFEKQDPFKTGRLRIKHKELIKKVIESNIGCQRPLIDEHLISILNVFIFFYKNESSTWSDRDFLHFFLTELLYNILVVYKQHKRFPELSGNINALIEFMTTNKRPSEYQDKSSLLINILFELIAILNTELLYSEFRSSFAEQINLQVAMTELNDEELEVQLFKKNLDEFYYVEHSIELPEKFSDFKKNIVSIPVRNYKTDSAGFPFLRILAHIYYKNELLPDEWRKFLHS
jgi:hypothetical protein